MVDLYETLSVIRTSLLNAVASKYIDGGTPLNINVILDSIVDELFNHMDFMEEIVHLKEEELIDLGFGWLHGKYKLMLFPVWLYPFIPNGTMLTGIDGSDIIKGEGEIIIYGDHWISVGLSF